MGLTSGVGHDKYLFLRTRGRPPLGTNADNWVLVLLGFFLKESHPGQTESNPLIYFRQ